MGGRQSEQPRAERVGSGGEVERNLSALPPRASPQPPPASARHYLYRAGATAPAPSAPRGGGTRQRSAAFRGRRGEVWGSRPAPSPQHSPAPHPPPPPPPPQTTDGRAVPAPPGVRPFPGCPRLTHILRPRPRRFPAPPPTARGGRPSPFRPQSRAPGGWGRLLSTAGAPPTTPPEPPPPHVGGSRVGITQPRGARCGDRSPVPRRDPHANNEMPPPDRRSRLSIKPAWGERGGRAAAER